MSEKSESDTSRVIKNPLLSASVTGLTFEDFPNKPLLLPAAPPVVAATVQEVQLEETQRTVTVGQKPEIDAETLSEINLNTTTDDESNYIDLNDKRSQVSEFPDGSILSQAASSFSRLPGVASTVLSTFSKVIKEYSPPNREENSEKKILQPEITDEILSPYVEPSAFSCRNQGYLQELEAEPPKLYSPSDVSHSSLFTSHPPLTENQNNYRLSAKKKTYAQIPGLSVNPQSTNSYQLLKPLDTNRNFITEPEKTSEDISNLNVPPTQVKQIDNGSISSEYKCEERKGLFPFSNLVPPVWKNLSGLVQSSSRGEIGEPFHNVSVETQEKKHLTTDSVFKISPNNLPPSAVFNEPQTTPNSLTCGYNILNPAAGASASGTDSQKNENFFTSTSLKETSLETESKKVNKNLHLGVSEKVPNFQIPPHTQESGSGGNSFRLQKGTRHYKSPFTNQLPSGIVPLPSTVELDRPAALKCQNASGFFETNTSLHTSAELVTSIYNPHSHAYHENLVPAESHVEAVTVSSERVFCHQNVLPTVEVQQKETSVLPATRQDILDGKNTYTPSSAINFLESTPTSAVNSKAALIKYDKGEQLGQSEKKIEKSEAFTSPGLLLDNHLEQDSHSEVVEGLALVEKPVFTLPSTQQFNQKQQLEGFSYCPPITEKIICTTQKLPGFSEQPSKVETFSTTTTVTTKIPENWQADEASNSSQEKLLTPSLNLSNYFSNSCSNSLQPQRADIVSSQTDPNCVQLFSDFGVLNTTTLVNPLHTITTKFFEGESNKEEEIKTSTSAVNIPITVPDPFEFFDSFHEQPLNHSNPSPSGNCSGGSNSLRIQDFFNNPPQSISDSGSDFNCKLVGSGVASNRLENLLAPTSENRVLSPVSHIVEPPLSSCSEFSSEFSSQITGHLSKEQVPDELLEKFVMAGILGTNSKTRSEHYQRVNYHWFYKKIFDTKHIWTPFSYVDSEALEDSYISKVDKIIVAVEGGRYDVNVPERTRVPVYWSGESTEVRRCSWFYKALDSKYIPYEEAIADLLEEEYRKASESGVWHRKISLPTGETVVFHGPTVMVHFLQSQSANDAWSNTTQTAMRPRVVKRDVEDFNIEPGESSTVDHILFMVHGVGSACDLKFRPLEEVVDEFRSIALQLIQSHYKNSCENGLVTRVEVLPVSWHSQLHSEESGIDEKLKAITLESIPKLRSFTNDTLLDILFYTSPIFCQNIMNTVCETLNTMYVKYCQRNPNFKGGVSLAGHSLGSLILFDLLCHQKPSEDLELVNSENPDKITRPLQFNSHPASQLCGSMSQQVSYTMGPAGTGQPYINYPQLIFHPKRFFALGSPIGMFVTIRAIDTLGLDFKLPTCTNFFHIFHPYDPVAYRIEALVNPDLSGVRPVLIPHHKGRKRMHLELKETMTRVGADLKQKIVDTFKNTLDSVNFLSSKNKIDTKEEIEKEVDKVLEMQLQLEKEAPRSRTNSTSTQSEVDTGEIDLPLGKLNDNRRIDYVLQKAPLEFFNEYLFAFASHVCYWESEDTILFIMKEIYTAMGIRTDSQIPQQSMTIERPNSRATSQSSSVPNI